MENKRLKTNLNEMNRDYITAVMESRLQLTEEERIIVEPTVTWKYYSGTYKSPNMNGIAGGTTNFNRISLISERLLNDYLGQNLINIGNGIGNKSIMPRGMVEQAKQIICKITDQQLNEDLIINEATTDRQYSGGSVSYSETANRLNNPFDTLFESVRVSIRSSGIETYLKMIGIGLRDSGLLFSRDSYLTKKDYHGILGTMYQADNSSIVGEENYDGDGTTKGTLEYIFKGVVNNYNKRAKDIPIDPITNARAIVGTNVQEALEDLDARIVQGGIDTGNSQDQITSNDDDILNLQDKDIELEKQITSNDDDILNLQNKDKELDDKIDSIVQLENKVVFKDGTTPDTQGTRAEDIISEEDIKLSDKIKEVETKSDENDKIAFDHVVANEEEIRILHDEKADKSDTYTKEEVQDGDSKKVSIKGKKGNSIQTTWTENNAGSQVLEVHSIDEDKILLGHIALGANGIDLYNEFGLHQITRGVKDTSATTLGHIKEMNKVLDDKKVDINKKITEDDVIYSRETDGGVASLKIREATGTTEYMLDEDIILSYRKNEVESHKKLNMSGNQIQELGDGTEDDHGVNLGQVKDGDKILSDRLDANDIVDDKQEAKIKLLEGSAISKADGLVLSFHLEPQKITNSATMTTETYRTKDPDILYQSVPSKHIVLPGSIGAHVVIRGLFDTDETIPIEDVFYVQLIQDGTYVEKALIIDGKETRKEFYFKSIELFDDIQHMYQFHMKTKEGKSYTISNLKLIFEVVQEGSGSGVENDLKPYVDDQDKILQDQVDDLKTDKVNAINGATDLHPSHFTEKDGKIQIIDGYNSGLETEDKTFKGSMNELFDLIKETWLPVGTKLMVASTATPFKYGVWKRIGQVLTGSTIIASSDGSKGGDTLGHVQDHKHSLGHVSSFYFDDGSGNGGTYGVRTIDGKNNETVYTQTPIYNSSKANKPSGLYIGVVHIWERIS